jgi:hypothetical protein
MRSHLVSREEITEDRKRKSPQNEDTVVDLTSDIENTNVMMTSEPILSILLASKKAKLFESDAGTNMLEISIPSSLRRRKMSTPKRIVPATTDS